jgi:hypothetical protein
MCERGPLGANLAQPMSTSRSEAGAGVEGCRRHHTRVTRHASTHHDKKPRVVHRVLKRILFPFVLCMDMACRWHTRCGWCIGWGSWRDDGCDAAGGSCSELHMHAGWSWQGQGGKTIADRESLRDFVDVYVRPNRKREGKVGASQVQHACGLTS